MLSLCRAYLVAQSEAQERTLARLAGTVGFGEVGSARAGDPIVDRSERRVDFFFLHHRLPDAAMQGVISSIRASLAVSIRFAPILLITDDQPLEVILKYIEFGFDDIVALPAKRAELVSRFLAQLNSNQTYVETPSYLGPDRRRFEHPDHEDPRRRGVSAFERLTIRRNPATGVKVLRREIVGQSPHRDLHPFSTLRRTTRVQMF